MGRQPIATLLPLLAVAANAMQPDAVRPVAAPMRNLTWGQLNFLHTTDTHSWLGGHLQEPQYSADWGDYISFAEHMRKRADDSGVDVILVDTGDRVEGNGLYDSSVPKGIYQYDIYSHQDINIISTGNHELYKEYSVKLEHNTTTKNYKDSYVASNLDYIDLKTGQRSPMAPRYRKFKTKNQGLEIISMGFIFNFKINAKNSAVQMVQDTVKEDWFQQVIKEKPDVFVIIGHVGVRMEEYKIILKAIRTADWNTPVLFFGGHVHVRDAVSYDSRSFAMASGRYMETIGWMSVDGLEKRQKDDKSKDVDSQKSISFSRKYMDNNLYSMHYHTGLNENTFPTKKGQHVSQLITDARKALHLDEKFGCSPQDYWMSRVPFPHKDNIYTLIQEEIFPGIVVNQDRKEKPRIALTNTGGIRFDIFKGAFTRDSIFNINPFVSTFRYIPDVPYKAAQTIISQLNSDGPIFSSGLDTKFMAIPQQMFSAPEVTKEEPNLELRSVKKRANEELPLIAGYITKDDIDAEGDDTIHDPIKSFRQPNCVQAEIAFPKDGKPETVDVVFTDYIQPWVIDALKFSGLEYFEDDIKVYMEGSFSTKTAEWISKNWPGDC